MVTPSVASKWVRAEASKAGETLVPVLIEQVALPLPFNETNTAYLVGWRGNRSASEYLLPVFESQALRFTYCEQKYEARVTTIFGQDRLAMIAVSSVPGGS